MKVEIGLRNLKKAINLKADYEDALAELNGKAVVFDVKNFVSKLLAIVCSWESEMINSQILDGCSYFVKVDNGNENFEFVGANKYPDNFNDFVALLEEVGVW